MLYPLPVRVLDAAADEVVALPPQERKAMVNAIEQLRADGERLGYPHTSAVKGAPETLRELRPRRGRSPWRVFYRREGGELVVAAVGPEAQVNPRGFKRAVGVALDRLAADRREREEEAHDGEGRDG